MENASTSEIVATSCFALAVLHTFLVKQFQAVARRFREGSAGENFFHLLGEVEVVFGFWAGAFLLFLLASEGSSSALSYVEGRDFTEPAFVFVIMAICSTRPILVIASRIIEVLSKLIPGSRAGSFYLTTLIVGPLLGSFITEPAAMTVTALILLERFYSRGISEKLMYATIGLLFVNVSIGGTLTPYAAPPVLMVAGKWNWDLAYMISNFGWKAALAVGASTLIVTFRFRGELTRLKWAGKDAATSRIPLWVSVVHLIFLVAVVLSSHHMALFIGIFLFFLGLVRVTSEYQEEAKLKEALLVAFFLGGLVVLGGPQRWWLEPILTRLDTFWLYLGAAGLTAVTDNAALTYLGAQVPSLAESSRYALVAGAVVGGGLTVIANAPNPAGFGILNRSFGAEGISPIGLFAAALPPTLIAGVCFWLF